ncbi:MAG: cupin domain-containing protein [Planctomycetes bacterium]|nr:cupin domain-containing protein [Planctomycetota bacterium]
MRRPFDRCNLGQLPLERVRAHGGDGTIAFCRVAAREQLSGALNFIDLAELPPGASIGRHQHADDEEEFYLVLSGSGRMERDGESFRVNAGDLIRNGPGGAHGLVNDGAEPLRLFVFEAKLPR